MIPKQCEIPPADPAHARYEDAQWDRIHENELDGWEVAAEAHTSQDPALPQAIERAAAHYLVNPDDMIAALTRSL